MENLVNFRQHFPVAITFTLSLILTMFTWALQDLPPRGQMHGISGVPTQYTNAGSDIKLRNLVAAAEFFNFKQKRIFVVFDSCCRPCIGFSQQ